MDRLSFDKYGLIIKSRTILRFCLPSCTGARAESGGSYFKKVKTNAGFRVLYRFLQDGRIVPSFVKRVSKSFLCSFFEKLRNVLFFWGVRSRVRCGKFICRKMCLVVFAVYLPIVPNLSIVVLGCSQGARMNDQRANLPDFPGLILSPELHAAVAAANNRSNRPPVSSLSHSRNSHRPPQPSTAAASVGSRIRSSSDGLTEVLSPQPTLGASLAGEEEEELSPFALFDRIVQVQVGTFLWVKKLLIMLTRIKLWLVWPMVALMRFLNVVGWLSPELLIFKCSLGAARVHALQNDVRTHSIVMSMKNSINWC